MVNPNYLITKFNYLFNLLFSLFFFYPNLLFSKSKSNSKNIEGM